MFLACSIACCASNEVNETNEINEANATDEINETHEINETIEATETDKIKEACGTNESRHDSPNFLDVWLGDEPI